MHCQSRTVCSPCDVHSLQQSASCFLVTSMLSMVPAWPAHLTGQFLATPSPPCPTHLAMARMEFILVSRVSRRSGNTVRRVTGILTDLEDQIQEFRNAGLHVVVLRKGVA